MLNGLWLAMVLLAFAFGAVHGTLDEVARAVTESATSAASLALGLLGPMVLWLGLVRVLFVGGLIPYLTKPFERLFSLVFTDVPKGHPALGLMTLNMASNVLGLGNAATPFGLKAMRALDAINPHKGRATNAMVLFLVINTSGLAVLPTGMVALRTSLGSQAPGTIFLPTVLSTMTAAFCGILAAIAFSRLPTFALPQHAAPAEQEAPQPPGGDAPPTLSDEARVPEAKDVKQSTPRPMFGLFVLFVVLTSLVVGLLRLPAVTDASGFVAIKHALHHLSSQWSLLVLLGLFVAFGAGRGVLLYDAVVEGGREAFDLVVSILPFLVAILVATGMLRASGAIDEICQVLGPYTEQVGLPASVLPMVFLRPLTGQGSYAVAADIMRAEGPDSLAGLIASTLMGTTETTFYVLALYFGAVGVRFGRHALVACLTADIAGTLMAAASCRWMMS